MEKLYKKTLREEEEDRKKFDHVYEKKDVRLIDNYPLDHKICEENWKLAAIANAGKQTGRWQEKIDIISYAINDECTRRLQLSR